MMINLTKNHGRIVKRWPLIGFLIFMLVVNQLLRSPFHIWNDLSTMRLALHGYRHVLYDRPEFSLGVLEKNADGNGDSVVVSFPDFRSAAGFWFPVLNQLPDDKVIRFVEWFGESDSEWIEQSIVFTDLDLMLSTVLSDNPSEVHIVGQGLGAWLALRYQAKFPDKNIRVTAIHPEGLTEAKLYPQTLAELSAVKTAWVGEQWVPTFALIDWLEWLDNPVKLAIHREMHLESVLEHSIANMKTEIIQLDDGEWKDCSHEVAWTCSEAVLTLFQ